MARSKLELIITADDKASGPLGAIGRAMGGIGTIAKGALIGGIGLAAGAIGGLGAVLVSSTKDAMAAQEVQAQLAAVLKSTDGAAGVTAKAANKYADSLSKVTRFDDEAILSGENLLLTFTNIGAKVFPQATETMLDMSQALGQDLKTSALQLGKALNDPIRGVTALRRVGVQFTQAQEDQIKAMVAAGDVAGAQAVILQELQKEFGGAAKAAGGTFAGQLDILKTSLGNVKENIGGALLPVLTELAIKFGPSLIAAAEGFSNFAVNTLVPAIRDIALWLGENVPKAITALKGFWERDVVPVLTTVWGFITESLVPAFTDVSYWLSENIPNAMATFEEWYNTHLKKSVDNIWKSLADPNTGLIPAFKVIADYLKIEIPKGFQETDRELGIAGGLVDGFSVKMFNLVKPIKDVLEFLDKVVGVLNDIQTAVNNAGIALHNFIEELLRADIFSIRKLLGFAGGTSFAPGGLALVGERGPEMVNLPRGSQVYTAGQTAGMLRGGAGAWSVTLNITGARDPAEVGRQAEAGVLRAARAMGVR